MDFRPEALSRPPLVVQRRRDFDLELRSIWAHRETLFFLAWRDTKVRYKQTALGAAWVLLQPLMTAAVFTAIFGIFIKIPTEGVPYPLFAFAGLVPWTCCAQATIRSGASVLGDAALISKVYFPRLIIPVAAIVTPAIDCLLSTAVLLALVAWYGLVPGPEVLLLPVFLSMAVLTALSVGICLAALSVRYRDVSHLIPFGIQLWMYMTPIVYPLSVVPPEWQMVWALNPMVAVVEGVRWAAFGAAAPPVMHFAAGAAVLAPLLAFGLVCFRSAERTFADVI